jgi:multiple sugar transport system ATP-binding protein
VAEISLHNVTKRFGETLAVAGLDLRVRDGEFMVILGPSGCGKTTTLRTMAGLETPDGGEVRMDGRRVNEVPTGERDIAFVFQHYALYPHLTIYRNLAFPLRAQKVRRADADARVREIARTLGIGELLQRRPASLSGADLQRVALGRAMIRAPRAFLMDEPLSNLDAALREHMRVELRKLQTTLGTTTVYVTHDQAEAMAMADTIAVMSEGKLQQAGTPSELYHQPANLFVANFIGTPSMNFLDGGELPPELLRRLGAPGGRKPEDLVVGVRPEDIELVPAQRDRTLGGEVYAVERLGYENLVDVQYRSRVLRVRTRGDVAPEAGTPVWVDICSRRSPCVFDRTSGDALSAAAPEGER